MACDRCGARIEGGAYPSDDEGSQDLCFDCAVADGAKNVAEAIQCAHGRRYGEPCPLRARVKELEERVMDDNAVCVCGCPAHDHESLGEDGEQCKHEDHECIRVAVSIREMYVSMRARVAKLEAERDHANMVADAAIEELKLCRERKQSRSQGPEG